MTLLEAPNNLTEAQYGFRWNLSYETQLINDLAGRLSQQQLETDVIFLDFSKRFDKLYHPTLT